MFTRKCLCGSNWSAESEWKSESDTGEEFEEKGEEEEETYNDTLNAEEQYDTEADVADNKCLKAHWTNPLDKEFNDSSYSWFPSLCSLQTLQYVQKLERDHVHLQRAFLMLTTHFARMQFRLRQIMAAVPEERNRLLLDLEKIAFESIDASKHGSDELPCMQRDARCMGEIRRKQNDVIEKLRGQLSSLYEATELDSLPMDCGENSKEKGRNVESLGEEEQTHLKNMLFDSNGSYPSKRFTNSEDSFGRTPSFNEMTMMQSKRGPIIFEESEEMLKGYTYV